MESLKVIAVIFVVIFLLIVAIRATLVIFLHFAMKKYRKLIGSVKKRRQKRQLKKKKYLPKADEALFRKKEDPLTRLPNKDAEADIKQEVGESKIVDIVKPVGFWTSMVLGQKLTYLVSSAKLMNDKSHKGFWVSMVEAQANAQGRQRGRAM